MTKQNFTSISILLDRSGSMASLSQETITGFNAFLAEQKAIKDSEAVLTLATFASDYKLVHDFVPLKDVPNLSAETYQCANYTALLDSFAKLIDDTGAKLAAMKEEDRPSRVICVVISDGIENRSRLFKKEDVLSRVSHQTDKYNWLFVYLGASLGEVADAVSLGVSIHNSVPYAATSAGIGSAYTSISSNMSTYRSSTIGEGQNAQINFFDQNDTNPKPIVVDQFAPVVPTTTTK